MEFKKQLLLRFALSCPSTGSTAAVIDDCFPPSLCLVSHCFLHYKLTSSNFCENSA